MAPPTKLYTISSLLMAALFAVSASFQLNDPDLFFWIPLYAGGSAVNLLGCSPISKLSARTIRRMARFSLWLGIFLFVKVVVETLAGDEGAGFWSLDMRERVVREKLGSGLVFVSMILQLAASSVHEKNCFNIQTCLYFGIRAVMAVAMICALACVFLVLITGTMIMHSASSSVQDDPTLPWQAMLEKYVDHGMVVLLGANYSVFFVLFALFFTGMALKPPASSVPARRQKERLQECMGYGMTALVGIGYGLSLVFHLYHKDQMKF